jgi:hypothetical protein
LCVHRAAAIDHEQFIAPPRGAALSVSAASLDMPKHASTDPAERMGVYTRLEDVPVAYRLEQYTEQYVDRDVWQAYVDTRPSTFDSDHYRNGLAKAGRSWKKHLAERGRHHALARPADAETWVQELATTRTHGTVYKEYWVRLEEFYTWLQFHTDHPHVYHPPMMAVVNGGLAGTLWRRKFDTDSIDEDTQNDGR